MKKLHLLTLCLLLSISNFANAHGEEALGFIFLQLISIVFVIIITLVFVKSWKNKLIVIFSSLPIGILLDSIPSNFVDRLFATQQSFVAFITVIPSLCLFLIYIAKLNLPSRYIKEQNNNLGSKNKVIKNIYTPLQVLAILPVLIATVAIGIVIADSIYVENTGRAFNKIKLNTSENAVVTFMGKSTNVVNCTYLISATNGAFILPGNNSGNYRDCNIEVHYESFFHGWAIGYTASRNVISKYEYLLEKPNLSFKRDLLKQAP